MGPGVQAPPEKDGVSTVKFGVKPGVYHRKAHGACVGAEHLSGSGDPVCSCLAGARASAARHACMHRRRGGACRPRRPGTRPGFSAGVHRRYEQRYIHEEASDYVSPRLHSVVLDGLKPATTYYYRVSSADGKRWSEVRG